MRLSSENGLITLYGRDGSKEFSAKNRRLAARPSQQRPITLKPSRSKRETDSQNGSNSSAFVTACVGNCAYGYLKLLRRPLIINTSIDFATGICCCCCCSRDCSNFCRWELMSPMSTKPTTVPARIERRLFQQLIIIIMPANKTIKPTVLITD